MLLRRRSYHFAEIYTLREVFELHIIYVYGGKVQYNIRCQINLERLMPKKELPELAAVREEMHDHLSASCLTSNPV